MARASAMVPSLSCRRRPPRSQAQQFHPVCLGLSWLLVCGGTAAAVKIVKVPWQRPRQGRSNIALPPAFCAVGDARPDAAPIIAVAWSTPSFALLPMEVEVNAYPNACQVMVWWC